MKALLLTLLGFLAFAAAGTAQSPPLTLARCYVLAEQNYPLLKQRQLIARASEYTIENLQKGYWPQLNVSGLASYQSAVTEIPIKIPGINIPTISKDQYKIYGEISETLYDGGLIRRQKESEMTAEEVRQRQLESSLFQLRSRINQLFFGRLLIDEELKQSDLLDSDIRAGLNKIQAAIANGTALKSNADILRADLLKNSQHAIELRAARRSFMQMLTVFINTPLDDSAKLEKPATPAVSTTINRPELAAYEAQNKNLDAQQRLLDIKAKPRLSIFFQGGAGRPALNFLSNNFETYYLGGLRLAWSPSALYTLKKEKAIIDISKKNTDAQKETFVFNTNLEVKQQHSEMEKYQQLLSSDDEIIGLRSRIKATSLAQLENGVIDSNDYLRQVNAENEARQNKIVHEIQLLTASYELQTTTGNQQ